MGFFWGEWHHGFKRQEWSQALVLWCHHRTATRTATNGTEYGIVRNALCSAAGCGNFHDQWWRAEEILTGHFFFWRGFFVLVQSLEPFWPGGQLKHFLLEVFIPQMRKWSNVTRFFNFSGWKASGAWRPWWCWTCCGWVGFFDIQYFSNYYTELPSKMTKIQILFWGGIYWVITIQLPFYRSEQRPKTLIICCSFCGDYMTHL